MVKLIGNNLHWGAKLVDNGRRFFVAFGASTPDVVHRTSSDSSKIFGNHRLLRRLFPNHCLHEEVIFA